MNNPKELEEKVKFITDYVKELNEYMSGKDEAAFRKDGVAPLEQHLMSIQLMTLTSAMIAMNDRLAILRNKASAKSEEVAPEKVAAETEDPMVAPAVESGPVIEPEVIS